jgi:hypothetical protein
MRGRPQASVELQRRRAGSGHPALVEEATRRDVTRLLAMQSGVVARRQVEAAGGQAHDIARMLRRREWVRLLPGVYVDHTGRPTWCQRAWGGVLYFAPAALADESALFAAQPRPGRQDDGAPIAIAIDRHRHVHRRPGYRLCWVTAFADAVLAAASPPRMRVEDAALRVASRRRSRLDAVQDLAEPVQARLTTPDRIADALGRHPKLPDRGWIAQVLDDLAQGSWSVLEHGYLVRVERAHGLPVGIRQHRSSVGGRSVYRDVDYAPYGVYVELDGTLFHASAAQHHLDLERDLEAAVSGRSTVRLGWGQVFDGACATAARVARLLRSRGWGDAPRPCGADCTLG